MRHCSISSSIITPSTRHHTMETASTGFMPSTTAVLLFFAAAAPALLFLIVPWFVVGRKRYVTIAILWETWSVIVAGVAGEYNGSHAGWFFGLFFAGPFMVLGNWGRVWIWRDALPGYVPPDPNAVVPEDPLRFIRRDNRPDMILRERVIQYEINSNTLFDDSIANQPLDQAISHGQWDDLRARNPQVPSAKPVDFSERTNHWAQLSPPNTN